MTITSSRYVEHGPAPDSTDGKRSPKPPPRIWQAIDPPFKGLQSLPTSAYSQSSPHDAIVIDNGTSAQGTKHSYACREIQSDMRSQAPPSSALASQTIQIPSSPFLQTWLVFGTGNSIAQSRTSAIMPTLMQPQGAKSRKSLSQGPALWATGMLWRACLTRCLWRLVLTMGMLEAWAEEW